MVRPGAYEFLEEMKKYYEIVIFTASVSSYAIPLISRLDKQNYQFQILFRQHWDARDNSFVKDLSKIGRDLNDVIMIDNTPGWYRLHKSNALPIVSWFEDSSDRELIKMIPLLQKLSQVRDVRPYIKKLVKSNKIIYSKINSVFEDLERISMKSESNGKPCKSSDRKDSDFNDKLFKNNNQLLSYQHQHIQSQYRPMIKREISKDIIKIK